jgi:transcriptional regulator with XRE-family HTH domain
MFKTQPKNIKFYPDTVAIKIEMFKKGIKARDIARKIGVSDMMISYVIYGKRTSYRLQKKIAEILRVDFYKIFKEVHNG